jgi:hypothetical protein
MNLITYFNFESLSAILHITLFCSRSGPPYDRIKVLANCGNLGYEVMRSIPVDSGPW